MEPPEMETELRQENLGLFGNLYFLILMRLINMHIQFVSPIENHFTVSTLVLKRPRKMDALNMILRVNLL